MIGRWILLVGVVIAATLVWIGGELHRANCIGAGRAACSVLIWDDGKTHGHLP